MKARWSRTPDRASALHTSDHPLHPSIAPFSPFLRFQIVGVLGAGVHLSVLFLLVQVVQLHYLWGTVLAVECALIHNFCWHLCWTWRNRPSLGVRELCHRLARFDCANGLVSMVGNAAVMRVLVGELHLPGLSAGGIAIVSCCLVNFVLGDRFVFRPLG